MKLTSFLFKAARLSADVNALSSPAKAQRRVKNKLIGRALGKAGFWRALWK